MSLETVFHNVVLGGYFKYGNLTTQEKVEDMLADVPAIKGLTTEERLEKVSNLAEGRQDVNAPVDLYARFIARSIVSCKRQGKTFEQYSSLFNKLLLHAPPITGARLQELNENLLTGPYAFNTQDLEYIRSREI